MITLNDTHLWNNLYKMCSVKRLENQIIYWYVFESMKIEEPKQDSQEEKLKYNSVAIHTNY
jgi:hypothetical protein